MCGYHELDEILPCPEEPRGLHDWCDYRRTSDDYYNGECTRCAALLRRHWWGWEFRTGEEHFDDFRQNNEEYLRDFDRQPRVAPAYARGAPPGGDPVIAARINRNTLDLRMPPGRNDRAILHRVGPGIYAGRPDAWEGIREIPT